MEGISYLRHFAALALIVILWVAYLFLGGSAILDDGLYVFAAVGALHAATLVIALTGSISMLRRAAFLVATAVVAAVVPFIGLLTLGLLPFDVLESLERRSILPYLMFGVASLAGALLYASLIKILIAPVLSWRVFVTASILSPVATVVVLAFQAYSTKLHEGIGTTVAWWLAFSTSLVVARELPWQLTPRWRGTRATAARAPHRER